MNRRNQSRPVFGREKRELKKPISTYPISEVRVISGPKPWYRRIFVTMEIALILVAIPMLIVELNDRQDDRITRAWQLITTSAPGNSGKAAALEYLNSETWVPDNFRPLISTIITLKEKISFININLAAARSGGGVYLPNLYLQEANFRSSDLSDVTFFDATLPGINLIDANLSNANLSGAILPEADLSIAKLVNTDLRDANLYRATLKNANLNKARLDFTNFHKANLENASLTESILFATNFSETNLSGADLTGATIEKLTPTMSKFINETPSILLLYKVECLDSWYWKDNPIIGDFPCISYREEEVSDHSGRERTRVYLRRPEPESTK